MKKIYKTLLMSASLFIGITMNAQVSGYVFQQRQASYTAISGGTVFGTPTSDDDYFCNGTAPTTNLNNGPGIQIGFTFTFNSIPFDVFGINNNGWICFGQSSVTPTPVNMQSSSGYTGLSATSTAPANLQHRVAALARDLQGNGGSLRVETIGSAPNRTCVIQWANYRVFAGTDIFNFQIRLIETTNIVQVVYGPWPTLNSTSNAQVGLRGATNADFNNRSVIAPNVWASSVAGAINTANCAWNTTGLKPNDGQVYEWIPPVPCTTPPPSDAVASVTNVCGGASVNLSLSTSYTNSGISYQWQSSSTGTAGSFANITGTNASVSSGTLGSTMAYRAVITCTNNNFVTSTPILVNVGAPDISNAVATLSLVCPNRDGQLSLSTNYAGLGVGYQWAYSNLSSVGPWTVATGTTAATSGTLPTYVSTSITTTMFYQAVLSCTAAPSLSTVTNPATINVAGTTTNSAPYYENFEGITLPNQYPNCSWSASNPSLICQTYTAAAANNRVPNSGAKFASFKSATDINGDYFYSNGIQLEPGVTYSASVWYITDGALGWTEFSLLIGTSQSTTGLSNIATVNSAIIANTFYKPLSNTFTVATSGLYYIAIKCKGAASNFFSFDDLRIDIPCSVNAPLVSATIPSVACSGQGILCSATGADNYLWMNNGATTANTNISLNGSSNISVVGTNSASGCSSTVSALVNILPSPAISVSAANNSTFICKGSSIMLHASGAGVGGIYSWSSGTTGISISVSPTVATSYTVTGTNQNNCTASAPITLTVKDPPTVGAIASTGTICIGETVTLTATGAETYTWTSNNNYVIGMQAVLMPSFTNTYTIEGTSINGCNAKSSTVVNVVTCVGINELGTTLKDVNVFPNPSNGKFTLEFTSESERFIEVLDLTGRLVLITNSNTSKAEINMSEFSAGVYYVKVKENDATRVLKVVKQ